ncbi:aminotransferase class I/II-fold pyridoxal phosphate-dependent enzyme [Lacrimispora xylanisolvens]|uniref:aminotransferase class I/II-fold pyridoxal phosphate-dependent enzyme n=1 Tax=Lacrimispora xylanisolvens TaxID=384636 RepID=UPI0032E8025C
MKNIILLRTFSKLYGLASFRIGYGIGDKEIIERINRVRSPINVNFSAQKAAEVSLDDEAFKNSVLNNNRKGLNLYYTELEKLGFPLYPVQRQFFTHSNREKASRQHVFAKWNYCQKCR